MHHQWSTVRLHRHTESFRSVDRAQPMRFRNRGQIIGGRMVGTCFWRITCAKNTHNAQYENDSREQEWNRAISFASVHSPMFPGNAYLVR